MGDATSFYQIMEPCNGGELQDKFELFKTCKQQGKGCPYDEKFVCDVMKQSLRALAFMHKKRYMHKDLKPQNIMLTDKDPQNPSIKVIDFGLAELFKAEQDTSAEI